MNNTLVAHTNQVVRDISTKLEQKNDTVQTSFFVSLENEKNQSLPKPTFKAPQVTAKQMLDGLQKAHDMAIEIVECAECIVMEMFEQLDETKSYLRGPFDSSKISFDSDRILDTLTALDVVLEYLCVNFSLDRNHPRTETPKNQQLELVAL